MCINCVFLSCEAFLRKLKNRYSSPLSRVNKNPFVASQMDRQEIDEALTIHRSREYNVSLIVSWYGHHLVLSRKVEDHKVALIIVLAQVDETIDIFLLNGLIRTKGQRGNSPS